MVMRLTVRFNFSLLVARKDRDLTGSGNFHLREAIGDIDVHVNLATNQIICSSHDVSVSTGAYEALSAEDDKAMRQVSEATRSELAAISLCMTSAARGVVGILKYHLGYVWIKETLFSIVSKEWSEGGENWRRFPAELSATVDGYSVIPLNQASIGFIQAELNSGIKPLIGARHLHRARNEAIPHHKWIDATTAAELAIKEILIRAQPELERLLTEVPSPPLPKLYGPLLEHYLGERSPHVNVIRKGVETRNALVHRPGAVHIDPQEAINYVGTVEAAIFHALRLLYPDDRLIEEAQRSGRQVF